MYGVQNVFQVRKRTLSATNKATGGNISGKRLTAFKRYPRFSCKREYGEISAIFRLPRLLIDLSKTENAVFSTNCNVVYVFLRMLYKKLFSIYHIILLFHVMYLFSEKLAEFCL